MRRLPLALIALSLPAIAVAQPIEGLYVGAGAGVDFHDNSKIHGLTSNGQQVLAGTGILPGGATFDPGYAGQVSVGYGLGNGVRLEIEGDLAHNTRNFGPLPKSLAALAPFTHRTAHETKYGAMANVLFDMDIGSPYIFPYMGAGAGYQIVSLSQTSAVSAGAAQTSLHVSGDKGAFAYQGIIGAAFPIPGVVGLSATLEYRFLGLAGTRSYNGTVTAGSVSTPISTKVSGDDNHQIMVGVRYAFDVPYPVAEAAEAAAAAPAAMVAPAPAPARSYLVFFDWDSAALTGRAQQIIADAAKNSAATNVTRIDVAGHADKSGTPAYNQTLSLKRANIVAAELVRLGVAKSAISISAFGDTKPLVPTAAGVREPQNRRVEIVLK